MTKHIQKNDLTGTWNIDTSNDVWVLDKNASITTNGTEAIDLGAEFTGDSIRLNGDITVTGAATYAIHIRAESTAVKIGKDAVIEASTTNVGIYGEEAHFNVDNAGIIRAQLSGIVGTEGMSVLNSGRIEADRGIASSYGSILAINSGKILGDTYGINIAAEDSGIVNGDTGVIRGGDTGINISGEGAFQIFNRGLIKGDTAIADAEGTASIHNRGVIDGDVQLGSGEDLFDTRGGILKGTVHGGSENDTYIVSSQSVKIAENALEGMDTVKSTVSYTLGDNLENLTLLGTRDLDATGNDANNLVKGNKGDNVLRGMGGEDVLGSDAGNDLMIGGADSDVFNFNAKNGHDTIKDFQDGSDVIFSQFIQSEAEVQDMLDNHATETNGGVLIEYGKNSLFIKGMDLDHLGADDFILDF